LPSQKGGCQEKQTQEGREHTAPIAQRTHFFTTGHALNIADLLDDSSPPKGGDESFSASIPLLLSVEISLGNSHHEANLSARKLALSYEFLY
jgi:hypothetical protein